MRSILLALSVLLLLSGCASTTMPSTPPMVPMLRPDACRVSCPNLPRLEAPDEAAVVIWMHEVIGAAGECRRLHDACRSAH